jgi:hypothetical protein
MNLPNPNALTLQDIYSLLQTVLAMLERQSEAINKVAEAQINLSNSQSNLLSRNEKILSIGETWSELHAEVAASHKILYEKYSLLAARIEEMANGYQKNDELLSVIVEVFGNDLKDLKRRVAQLEGA